MTTPTRPKVEEIEKKDGDCFKVAASIVALFDCQFALTKSEFAATELVRAIGREEYNVYLTHGWVTRPTDGVRHEHAWVEIPDVRLVIDYSNGLEVMTPIAHYYKAGKVNPACIKQYGYDETRQLLVKHEHYGPWEDMDKVDPPETTDD